MRLPVWGLFLLDVPGGDYLFATVRAKSESEAREKFEEVRPQDRPTKVCIYMKEGVQVETQGESTGKGDKGISVPRSQSD